MREEAREEKKGRTVGERKIRLQRKNRERQKNREGEELEPGRAGEAKLLDHRL